MKKYLFYLFFVLIVQTGFGQYENRIKPKEALQAAFTLRNAAVKIIKDYIYLNMRVSYAVKNIDDSFSDSEDALLLLEAYAENKPDINATLQKLINIRKKTRMIFLQKPKKEKIKTALQKLENLLSVSNQLIDQIKNDAHLTTVQSVKNAHNLELISQQLAFLHSLRFSNTEIPGIEEKIREKEIDFETNLNKLKNQTTTNKDIAFQLSLIESDWKMYKRIAAKPNERFVNTIYTLMDEINKKAHNIARLIS